MWGISMPVKLTWEYQSTDVEVFRSDGHHTVETWIPDDPFDVAICLTIHVGPKDSIARDLFETAIYTKTALKKCEKEYGKEFTDQQSDTIVVERYVWPEIRKNLDAIIEGCLRETPGDTLNELRKHFHWEYEGDPLSYRWD